MNNKNNNDLTLFPASSSNLSSIKKPEQGSNYPYAVQVWSKCLQFIRDNVSSYIFKTWFEPIKVIDFADDQITVQVPSQFFYEWIEDNYYDLMQKTLLMVLGEEVKIKYNIVIEDKKDENQENPTIKMPGLKYPPRVNLNGQGSPDATGRDFDNNLAPKYNFDNFITGESNQLASSAAMAVAQKIGGNRYNPLVIYGDTGLGKTHLVCAIGNEVLKNNPNARVLYINSERFTMDFVNAIQNNKVNEFINFYRSIDVLLVDDIQFFSGKEKTQDNFFHTFNALHQSGKQLVLTSDKPPRELKDVDDRLISRFQWGLTVDIQKPDLETRMAILRKKSEDEGIELPHDIVEYIAQNVNTHVREMEGILISILAKVTLDRRELNIELAKEVVQGVANYKPKPLTVDEIKKTVASYYKVSVDQIESKTRKHEIALARQMSMYLTKQLTQLSLKSIGSHFGNRDHTTVLHSYHTIENYLQTDQSVKEAYNELYKQIKRK